jgi:putative addiction module killer protein
MYTLLWSLEFEMWLAELRDRQAKSRILSRLDNASLGNFGDWKAVGAGICEMRIHAGPGYRIYYTRTGTTVYVLLTGGDKSTQKKDILLAKQIAREIKGETQ